MAMICGSWTMALSSGTEPSLIPKTLNAEILKACPRMVTLSFNTILTTRVFGCYIATLHGTCLRWVISYHSRHRHISEDADVVLGFVCDFDGTTRGDQPVWDSFYYGADMRWLGFIHESQHCRANRQWRIDCDRQYIDITETSCRYEVYATNIVTQFGSWMRTWLLILFMQQIIVGIMYGFRLLYWQRICASILQLIRTPMSQITYLYSSVLFFNPSALLCLIFTTHLYFHGLVADCPYLIAIFHVTMFLGNHRCIDYCQWWYQGYEWYPDVFIMHVNKFRTISTKTFV